MYPLYIIFSMFQNDGQDILTKRGSVLQSSYNVSWSNDSSIRCVSDILQNEQWDEEETFKRNLKREKHLHTVLFEKAISSFMGWHYLLQTDHREIRLAQKFYKHSRYVHIVSVSREATTLTHKHHRSTTS